MNHNSDIYDAAIIGAGPAGTSAAIHLALRGRRVLLAEAKSFPRAKLCGEFITPECFAHFRRLGVEAAMMDAGGTRIAETVFFAASGARCEIPSSWFAAERESFALGLSRAEMDARLLARAREVGVEVREETQAVSTVCDEDGVVRGVRLRGKDKGEDSVCARVTIDATGRARALTRRVEAMRATNAAGGTREVARGDSNHKIPSSRTRAALVAFKTHLVVPDNSRATEAGDKGEQCEIYFYKGGYGGLNGVEGGRRNLCFIVRAEDVKACGGSAERAMREVVCGNRRARSVLDEAETIAPWLCVALENFGCGEIAPAPGLLTVGDAAAFIDPFTGSGMLMALDGGATLARAVAVWLKDESHDDANIKSLKRLAFDYEAIYEARFARRLRVCAWLRRAAFAPAPMIEAATRMLSANTGVRRRLARATRKG